MIAKNIKRSFNRAAITYDQAATLQLKVGESLLKMVADVSFQEGYFLDLGAGTGVFTKKLLKKYKKNSILALDIAENMLKKIKCKNLIQGDIHSIPLITESVNFIFSNMALQWSKDFSKVCLELNRVLKKNEYVAFSATIKGTLQELHSSWNNEVKPEFLTHEQMESHLTTANFKIIRRFNKSIVVYYKTVNDIIRNLKMIGAQNFLNKTATLIGKSKWQNFTRNYEKHRQDNGMLPVTYQIILCLAQKNA